MQMIEKGNSILLRGAEAFDLKQTFTCGQCFRWDEAPDGTFRGVHSGRALRIGQQGDTVTLYNTTLEDYHALWRRYFDLDRDYCGIQAKLSRDTVLRRAIRAGRGIRLLAQEPFETLISFIISANNNIPRIKGIIARLCEAYGTPIPFEGDTCYAFPCAQTLAALSREDLSPLRAGFRDKYIIDAAQKVASGAVDLATIYDMDYDAAKNELKKINGIGDKVADCVLLFGFGKHDAFPVDVWVRRILDYYYPGGTHRTDAAAFARERFGALGGYAQQYLFYYARENKIACENKIARENKIAK